MTCVKSRYGIVAIGLEDDKYVSQISVEDCQWNNVTENGNRIENVKDITMKNLYINGKLVK